MSNYKFLATNRQRFVIHKTQQISPYELSQNRKHSQKHRELLMPIDKFPRKVLPAGKPIRSQGKASSQRQSNNKMPAVDLINLKQSLLLKNNIDSFVLKEQPKKKLNSNRLITEKISTRVSTQNNSNQKKYPISYNSAEKKFSMNKIFIKGGAYTKDLTPERNNFIKGHSQQKPVKQKIWISQRLIKDNPSKSLQKKLTTFQRQQSKNYQIFYIGTRRVYTKSDFTDAEGDPKVLVGDSIAYKYEIISTLGRGSFGKVFKAYDHKKKQYIALKIIKSQQKFTTQAKIQVEILQKALLHDPKLRSNIVRLKGSFQFRGHMCLKFEILSKNLYEFLKESNFSGFTLDLIRRFSIQILQSLLFFSQHKIVHCDLKPQNILLKQQNRSGIKVIDVGSGCFQNKQIYTYIQSRFYRAPQIVLGIRYNAAIDMWSFGCILIQLYTGVPIFPGENQNQQMMMFMEILGLPPKSVLDRAQRKRKFFNDACQCKISQQKGKEKIIGSIKWEQIIGKDCDKNFVDLIRKCLEWDPKVRITPKDALLHQWIINGLPEPIRAQHIQHMKQV